MGLNPIEYRPWSGRRSEHGRRFQVIADSILRRNLGSKWFLGVLIIGTFLVYAMPIIFLSISPHDSLTAQTMADQMKGGLFYLFIVILAAMLCSDLLAEDLRSNSFVLYLSRALRPADYLAGKFLGALATLSIFALLPAVIMGMALMATQTGPDYASSLGVIGSTVIAGALASVYLIPVALMISSLTKRRTYAAVGAFMSVFVLGIIAGIFLRFDANWALLAPQNVLSYCYDVIYGLGLPSGVDGYLLAIVVVAFTVLPLLFAYYQVLRKGVGK